MDAQHVYTGSDLIRLNVSRRRTADLTPILILRLLSKALFSLLQKQYLGRVLTLFMSVLPASLLIEMGNVNSPTDVWFWSAYTRDCIVVVVIYNSIEFIHFNARIILSREEKNKITCD